MHKGRRLVSGGFIVHDRNLKKDNSIIISKKKIFNPKDDYLPMIE